MNSVIEAFTIKRTYNHPPDLVFRAWTEPRRMEKWFCPNPKNKVEVEIDLRVGGRYKISMIPASGDAWVVGGEYREITRPEKLTFTWKWVTDPTEGPGTLVTVQFVVVDSVTEVVLTHDNLESEESRTNHGEGWNATMDRLTEYLEDPMEALMTTSPDLISASAQIQQAKQVADMSLRRLKDTFAHIPDERLFERAAETCRAPLGILLHTAFSNQYFAAVLRGDAMEAMSPADIVKAGDAKAASIKARSEAEELLESTSQEVLDSYDKLDPARLTSDPRVGFILTLVGRHVDGHAAQIDYIQTTWGDLEDHFGM
jgi:uncharacterized protein YndB with AHSA1/START domain